MIMIIIVSNTNDNNNTNSSNASRTGFSETGFSKKVFETLRTGSRGFVHFHTLTKLFLNQMFFAPLIILYQCAKPHLFIAFERLLGVDCHMWKVGLTKFMPAQAMHAHIWPNALSAVIRELPDIYPAVSHENVSLFCKKIVDVHFAIWNVLKVNS